MSLADNAIRSRVVFALEVGLAALLGHACHDGRAAAPATTPRQEARHYFKEPPPALPAQPVGHTHDRVVSLRTPFARSEALVVVDRFFDAITMESNTHLAEILTEDATIRYGSGAPATQALLSWVRRFAQMDYQPLRSARLYRERDVEVYSAEDVAVLSNRKRFAIAPEGQQLLVRFPIAMTERSGKARLGNELQLLLEPTEQGLAIAAIVEDGFIAQ